MKSLHSPFFYKLLITLHFYPTFNTRFFTFNSSTCFGTLRANRAVASLMQSIKTPPPTLLRARFATVLGHLPSVPSVVLPNRARPKRSGSPLLNHINTVCLHTQPYRLQFALISVITLSYAFQIDVRSAGIMTDWQNPSFPPLQNLCKALKRYVSLIC